MFHYLTVSPEFGDRALIGFLTVGIVRINSDWLSSQFQDNLCWINSARFLINISKHVDKSMSDCVLCFSPIVNHNDKNLVQGRGQFKVIEEISSLQFVVHCPSPYICKSCVAKLQKRRGLHDNLKKIDEDHFNDYSSKAFKAGLTVKKKFQESVDSSASPEKRILLDESVSAFTEQSYFGTHIYSSENHSSCHNSPHFSR